MTGVMSSLSRAKIIGVRFTTIMSLLKHARSHFVEYVHLLLKISKIIALPLSCLNMSSFLFLPILLLLFCSIALIAEVVIFCKLIWQLYWRDQTRGQISTFQTRVHAICFCCIIMTSLCDTAHALVVIILNTRLTSKVDCIVSIEIIADVFYFASSVLIYLLLFDRLHKTFQDTSYRLTQTTMTLFYIMIVIQCLLMTAYCIDQYIDSHFNTIWLRISGAISTCILILDILLNLFFLALFIRKLRQSVMMRLKLSIEDSGCDNQLSRCRSIDDSLNQRTHSKIVNVIVKQLLIGTPIIFCSVAFLMTAAIEEAFYEDSQISRILAYSSRAAEGVLISCLLFWGLSVNESTYKQICGRCHRSCYRYAQNQFKQDVTRDYYPMDELDLSQTYSQFAKNIQSL